VDALYATDWHEYRSVSIALLARYAALLHESDLPWLAGLVRRSDTWAHVDWLAADVIGGVVERYPASLKRLAVWANDPSFWLRRTALLAQLRVLSRGAGDFDLFARLAARMLHERAVNKNAASNAIKTFLNSLPDSPEHLDARRLATDLLDLPPETQAAFAPVRGRSSATTVISPRLLGAGDRLERSALAGVAAHPKLNRFLEEVGPEHFDSELHKRARAHLLGQEDADGELTPLLAEIYALSETDDITEETAEQMLLRLRERRLQRQLSDAESDHFLELQQRLAEVRTAIREFA